MKKHIVLMAAALLAMGCASCTTPAIPEDNIPENFTPVNLSREITSVQPGTGLVLWTTHGSLSKYSGVISLEYSYCLPCKVVTGKKDGKIQYDWSWFEKILSGIASRGHQMVVRFRYEYPGSKDVDGTAGSTAVPQYIKDLPDYKETYNKNEDGATYYADWSNPELQWFTKQFYTDFAAKYGEDPRIAFLEVGFGHWGEYHIYGTPLKLGVNFPSHAYQAEFLKHVASVMPIPWLISIDAADRTYTPVVRSEELMALGFGLFDDSFMHEEHEGGYNEECWNAMGKDRWQTGPCGGEISYYTSRDQKNFLNPAGMYGVTWEQAAAKYHISFMISNDAPGTYGTVDRFREAGLASGYKFAVTELSTDGTRTALRVTNNGVAPIYRDAFFAIGSTRSKTSLKGLLPGESKLMYIDAPFDDSLHIESDYILPSQTIGFQADL